ncbi:tRNA pseudouridine synthase A [Euzebyella saccharophila]|uniref:tRNA pseudouridine synthase A n=1 Tax=Euzebyella saccharophila TaxID=679664 RepID=A0ABV8JVJ3_9FLAO|nr:tRNA pseudouridine(38-40) synthase TruA [Euzebyella saccharophila]
MQKQRYYYLIQLQYLGFRYSGWQHQPRQKTIESMLQKTLKFILPRRSAKVLGAGRTDAKVSALDMKFELFLEDEPLEDLFGFQELFNKNLPPDIRILNIRKTNSQFNIIQDAKEKEYLYLFSFGEKNHPFCAPFLANIIDDLDIELMIKAARLFEGTHDFLAYTARLREGTRTLRTITHCSLSENTLLKANFFPKKSYVFAVRGNGFMRYQIRMMMGALIQLGRGELTFADIENSLLPNSNIELNFVAPGSGLLLNRLDFN